MEKSSILITGGCGFVGHHFVEHFIKNTDWDIIVFDKLSYASGGFSRLRDINVFDDKRVRIFTTDLILPISEGIFQEIGHLDYIINIASESHVDNSIFQPTSFILNNIELILRLFDWTKMLKKLKLFVQFSTDEVYGPAPEGVNYSEGSRMNPTNPYSASKGAQECICRSFSNTYKLPIIITNTMNVFGERQHPEKFIPSTIRKILNGETVIIHANKEKTKVGSRFYIHARNVAQAVHFLLDTKERLNNFDASLGQFNIVGEKEIDNLALAQTIANILKKPLKHEMVDFHSSRPGHDLRYALNGSKMKKLGWNLPQTFENSLFKTINWTLEHPKWLKNAT